MLTNENKNILRISSVLMVLVWVVASWFLIHFLAILGLFLGVAYPIWWIFFPHQTVCFLCRTRKEGDRCPFCKRIVVKEEGLLPKSLTSAIYNGLLILVFSLISFGVVYGESQILLKLGFPPTEKTVSFVIPTKGQYYLGEIFPMELEINGIKTPINTVQTDLSFDPSKLEVIDISTEESFANIFIQKEINNEVGYARLTGGLPNPGYASDRGVFGTVYFKTKEPGVVKIEFLPSSLVLANDGKGTNVLKDLTTVSYLILPERISQEEKDLQDRVYSQSVLGENAEDEIQMKFFEENDKLELGIETEIEENKTLDKVISPIEWLQRIDQYTLNIWREIFGIE